MSRVSQALASSRSRFSSSVRNAFHPRRKIFRRNAKAALNKETQVVCQAGPRYKQRASPSPSRFHKNSFKPFETRVDSGDSGARAAPPVDIGHSGSAANASLNAAEGKCRGSSRFPFPGRVMEEAHFQSAAVPEFSGAVSTALRWLLPRKP